jgi:hypothetical protein
VIRRKEYPSKVMGFSHLKGRAGRPVAPEM